MNLVTDDPDTTSSLANLALVLQEMGGAHVTKAVAMWRTVVTIYSKRLTQDHPETLKAKKNLSIALDRSGDLHEALAVSRAVYNSRKRKIGPRHPDTLACKRHVQSLSIRTTSGEGTMGVS